MIRDFFFFQRKFWAHWPILTEFKCHCFLKIMKFLFAVRKLELGKKFLHLWKEKFQRTYPGQATGTHSVWNKHSACCLWLDLKLMDMGGIRGSGDCREGNLSKEYGKGAWAVAVWRGEWCKPQICRKPGFISSTAFGTTCLNFPCR